MEYTEIIEAVKSYIEIEQRIKLINMLLSDKVVMNQYYLLRELNLLKRKRGDIINLLESISKGGVNK